MVNLAGEMSDDLILTHDDLIRLHRHYINLTCVDSGPHATAENCGNSKRYNFSAFVVDVEGIWLAITAGHVFGELRKAMIHGAVLTDWAIDDSMVSDHNFPAYPISVNLGKDVIFFDEDGLDYGAYILDEMVRIALTKSGIVPISAAQWNADDLAEFPFWTLIGLPTKFADLKHDGPSIKSHVSVHVEGLMDRPASLADTKCERLYAKVDFSSVAELGRHFDIGGMSGGPIFGTRLPPQGASYDYRLIGIQSAWDQRENVVICAAQPFLQALSRRVRSLS